MVQIRDSVTLIHRTVNEIRSINQQLLVAIEVLKKQANSSELQGNASQLQQQLSAIENELIQPGLTIYSGEMDAMHHPSKLVHILEELGYQVVRSDHAPTAQMHELYRQLRERVDYQINLYNQIKAEGLSQFNNRFAALSITMIKWDNSESDIQ